MPTPPMFRRTVHATDRFQPEAANGSQDQRRLRGRLEQIDYVAFAANCAVLAKSLPMVEAERLQRLAVAAAEARARWAAAALIHDAAGGADSAAAAALADRRAAFEELGEAYEALRRMVERGYVPYRNGAGS